MDLGSKKIVMFSKFACLFLKMTSAAILHPVKTDSRFPGILFSTAFVAKLTFNGNVSFKELFMGLENLNFLLFSFLVDDHGLLKRSYRINYFEKNHFS